jgi:predicted transcriptional regulator
MGAMTMMIRETSINVRVANELRAKLEKLAAEDHRTLSSYVEKLLKQHVAERDKGRRK